MKERHEVRLLSSRTLKAGFCALALALGSLTASPAPVFAEEYRLGPQDKVRIRIYEWRASRDEIFEWKALNDTFVVGPDGMLSLPFAGDVMAAGRTTTEVADEIGSGLMQNMGLGRKPDARVEVVEFRPFFIIGEINLPGAFPYRPDLTILQAVSLAGGVRREIDRNLRLDRERIQSRGDLSVIGLERLGLLARKARLEAELAEADTITFPAALTDLGPDSVARNAMEQERFIFEARKEGLATQIRALDDLARFLEGEVVSLEKQLELYDQQIESIRKELESVTSLVARGIAPAPRQLGLERELAEKQGDRLEVESALLRAKQEISKAELSKIELRNRHANEAASGLRETEIALDTLDRRAETALHLLHESETYSPIPLNAVKYTIVRTDETGTKIIEATESTLVLPGDTVKVEALPPDRRGREARSAS